MQKIQARLLIGMVVSTIAFALPALAHCGACGSSHSRNQILEKKETTMEALEIRNIVETAIQAGSFKTLVAAVKAAELGKVLQGEGPFTVFAPTDEAFAKLPKGTLEELLKPENSEKLRAVLTYHVVPGKVTSSQVAGLQGAKTVQGQEVSINVSDGTVMIDNAKVTQTDIEASNGVIHVIDNVILPKNL